MSYYVKHSAFYHARIPLDKVLAIYYGLTQVSMRYRPNTLISISIEVSSTSCLASAALIIGNVLRSTFLLVIFGFPPPPLPLIPI